MATFENDLAACTSETLPSPSVDAGDQTLDPEFEKSLNLSDQIRSGKAKAPDAVRAFRRRLANKNANVVVRALLTLDTCIKNSGDAFLKEVAGVGGNDSWTNSISTMAGLGASTTLSNDLDGIIRKTSNNDVRQTALRLLQNWATAFQSKPSLSISELVLLYRRLQTEGIFAFPPVSKAATAAMIDSISAPNWTADAQQDRCERCRDAFTLTNRRHHCRNCGGLFDNKCSSLTLPLPHFGITESVRVCDGCYKKVKSGQLPAANSTLDKPYGNPLYPRYSGQFGSAFSVAATPPQTTRSTEEDDLQRAIRLSLQDQPKTNDQDLRGPLRSSGYRPSYEAPSSRPQEQEEDPDLAAAIAASLRDMEAAPSAPPEIDDDYARYSNKNSALPLPNEAPVYKPLPPVDLTPTALDNMLTFSQTAKLHQTAPHVLAQQYPDVVGTLAQMQERAEFSRKDLIRSVRDSAGREQVLLETVDKMREIMRSYERLLERQVAVDSYQPSTSRQDYYSRDSAQVYRTPSYASSYHQPSGLPPYQSGQPQQEHYQPDHRQFSADVNQHPAHFQQQPQYYPQQPQHYPQQQEAVNQTQYTQNNPSEQYRSPPRQPAPLPPQEFQPQQDFQHADAPPFSPSMQSAQMDHNPWENSQNQYVQSVPQQTQNYASQPQQQQYDQFAPQVQHEQVQRQPSLKIQQARQLVNLPHAPSGTIYSQDQFPQVPVDDFTRQRQPQQQEASLIDL